MSIYNIPMPPKTLDLWKSLDYAGITDRQFYGASIDNFFLNMLRQRVALFPDFSVSSGFKSSS